MSPDLLTVSDLHKTFVLHAVGGRRVVALDGVDLSIGPGRHVALAGPSGAGKSSLLKCVYRTYLPTRGSVQLRASDGHTVDLTTIGDRQVALLRDREMGYVSQFLRSEPRRPVFEVVVRAARRRGMEPNQARAAAADALAAVQLDEALWGTYPTLLSGGEQQRLNLAAGTVAPHGCCSSTNRFLRSIRPTVTPSWSGSASSAAPASRCSRCSTISTRSTAWPTRWSCSGGAGWSIAGRRPTCWQA
jgi:alpha-D-ribose 1-methylphosphonate 5-triphosphate synthase subunit PhnL